MLKWEVSVHPTRKIQDKKAKPKTRKTIRDVIATKKNKRMNLLN